MKQNFIGTIVAGQLVGMVVDRVLKRIAKSPTIPLRPEDVPAVREAIRQSVQVELDAAGEHATNTEPAYKSRVTQGSLLVAMTAVTDLVRLWQDGVENTPMDYATPAVALVGVAWALYGRWMARKPFGT